MKKDNNSNNQNEKSKETSLDNNKIEQVNVQDNKKNNEDLKELDNENSSSKELSFKEEKKLRKQKIKELNENLKFDKEAIDNFEEIKNISNVVVVQDDKKIMTYIKSILLLVG